MLVRLSAEEIESAALVGVRRNVYNLAHGRRNRYGHVGLGWDAHIEGACAEFAAAKALGEEWRPQTEELDDDVGDLGAGRQIRSTTRPNGRLIVHEADADDHKFLLAIVLLPDVKLAGWLYGREAKRPEFWADPSKKNRPAFFVPQSALRRLRLPVPA